MKIPILWFWTCCLGFSFWLQLRCVYFWGRWVGFSRFTFRMIQAVKMLNSHKGRRLDLLEQACCRHLKTTLGWHVTHGVPAWIKGSLSFLDFCISQVQTSRHLTVTSYSSHSTFGTGFSSFLFFFPVFFNHKSTVSSGAVEKLGVQALSQTDGIFEKSADILALAIEVSWELFKSTKRQHSMIFYGSIWYLNLSRGFVI